MGPYSIPPSLHRDNALEGARGYLRNGHYRRSWRRFARLSASEQRDSASLRRRSAGLWSPWTRRPPKGN